MVGVCVCVSGRVCEGVRDCVCEGVCVSGRVCEGVRDCVCEGVCVRKCV